MLAHENTHWPSWFYPPETEDADPAAHGKIFDRAEDVPEGWRTDWRAHGTNLNREPPPPPPAPKLTRTELRRELDARDITYPPQAGVAELQKLYDEALEAEAEEASV